MPDKRTDGIDDEAAEDEKKSLKKAVIIFAIIEALVLIPLLIYMIAKRS